VRLLGGEAVVFCGETIDSDPDSDPDPDLDETLKP
jgi:hypothetical protein